jgi:hypothetical protein
MRLGVYDLLAAYMVRGRKIGEIATYNFQIKFE